MKKVILATDDSAKGGFFQGLTDQEFEIIIVGDAYALIEEIEKTRQEHVVLMDARLPGMTGAEVCQQVQRVSHRGNFLLVEIQESVDENLGLEFLQSGGDHIIAWSEHPVVIESYLNSFFRMLIRHKEFTLKLKADQDRYITLEPIAEGGGGSVYRGMDRKLEREVAIKFLKSDSAMAEDVFDQALQEAKLLAQFYHPNLVTVFDVGESEEGAFVVMEIVEGESLKSMLSLGPLRPNLFRQLVEQSLKGISSAHSRGILHLDLKPGNMMFGFVSSTGSEMNLKILDFGIARAKTKKDEVESMDPNKIVGSLPYMAPERFQGLPLDRRADLYSLGHIFYEALTGHHAFRFADPQLLLQAHLSQIPASICEARPDLSPELDHWIQRFLLKEAQDRFSSAKEALAEFLKIWN